MVELRGVTKRYHSTVALDDLSLDVGRGEFVAVVGPSGSGKTTLLHLLAALERPTSGTISVDGHRIDGHGHALNEHRRSRVGLIFQLHNLIPRLTAAQNVQLPMFGTHAGHRRRVERSHEMLDMVGLGGMERRYPPAMSGGERQRVAIARALANEPMVVLADEPTSGLDDAAAGKVLDMFEQLTAERSVTVITVSHDDRLICRAHRQISIAGGRARPEG